MLRKIYGLRQMSKSLKIKDDLELLASFDVVRPLMLRRLIDIRNFVEHQDSTPPSSDECRMFADLVWYFLRSTDSLVRSHLDNLIFYAPGPEPFLERRKYYPTVEVKFSEEFATTPQISAGLNPPSISYEANTDWITIEAIEIISLEVDEPHMLIRGKMSASGEQMGLLYRAYFTEQLSW